MIPLDSTDRIEKLVVLRAPRARVWDAIRDARQFGAWFGCELDGPFVAGERITGRIVPTQVHPDVAAKQEPHRGAPFELHVERIEPMAVFAFRWRPFGTAAPDPMTLVTFELADADGGTLLRITESGFDAIPPERRAAAFAANDGGWTMQGELIARYLAEPRT